MNKKEVRQNNLLQILKDQGTGVVSMMDSVLSVLLSVTSKTIQRDLEDMNYRKIILKQTKVIKVNGKLRKQRDIIIPGEIKRKFAMEEHRFLMNKEHHMIFTDDATNEVIWMRRPDGIHWERNLPEKEFTDTNQALNWMYYCLPEHNHKYLNGSNYSRA